MKARKIILVTALALTAVALITASVFAYAGRQGMNTSYASNGAAHGYAGGMMGGYMHGWMGNGYSQYSNYTSSGSYTGNGSWTGGCGIRNCCP